MATSRKQPTKAQTAQTPPEVRPRLQDEYVGVFDTSIIARTLTPSDLDYYGQLDESVIDMMLCDAVISSDYDLLNENVLADGGQIIPAITSEPQATGDATKDEESKRTYALAQQISEFCTRAVEGMETDPVELFEQMLEARRYGNRVAEVTYEPQLDGANSKLVLKNIKVKSRGAVQFVLDAFNNLLGFTTGFSIDRSLKPDEQILPRVKFFLFTYRKTNEDPRGQQGFRSLLCAWRQKIEAWPILQRYMKLFAVPGLVAKPSPTSQNEVLKDPLTGEPVKDTQGNVITLTPQQALRNALLHWENSTVVVVAPGAEVEPIQATGEGQLFVNHFRLINSELTRGQLRVTRATSEAVHGSKADSETAVDMMSTLVLYLKHRLAAAFRRDVLFVLTWLNFGEKAAKLYTPFFQFGDDDRYNWAQDAQAVTLFKDCTADSQWDFLTASAGIPPPLEGEERPNRSKMPASSADQPIDPNAPPADKPKPGQPAKQPADQNKQGQTLVVRDVLQHRAHTITLRRAA